MADFILEIIISIIIEYISKPLLIFISWIIASPVIFIMSFYGKNTYLNNLISSYSKIKIFWYETLKLDKIHKTT